MSAARGRVPRLTVESGLHADGFALVAGIDEVGRGALSGPVTLGVVVVASDATRPPRGLRDSKLLTPAARRALVPRIERWVLASAVASASAAEVDAVGILAACRLAGHRAVTALPVLPDCLLLDGNHDYLSPLRPGQHGPVTAELLAPCPPVRTLVKADLRCASVAAASVLAKTHRDAVMEGLAVVHPEYGWEVNKGYATPAHQAALRAHGPSPQHRVSWRLPGRHEDPALADEELAAAELAAGWEQELGSREQRSGSGP